LDADSGLFVGTDSDKMKFRKYPAFYDIAKAKKL